MRGRLGLSDQFYGPIMESDDGMHVCWRGEICKCATSRHPLSDTCPTKTAVYLLAYGLEAVKMEYIGSNLAYHVNAMSTDKYIQCAYHMEE